jgi:MGT family glycosyltransferase
MTPLRVAYFSLPISGHVNPALPVLRTLLGRGAEVVAYSSDSVAPRITATGVQLRPYPPQLDPAVAQPSDNFIEVAALLARITEQTMLGFALTELRSEPPDVVVSDSMAPWGRLAAQLLGLPSVTLTSSFVVHAGLGGSPRPAFDVLRRAGDAATALRTIAGVRRRLRARRGVDVGGPIRLLSNRGDATIAFTSRQLQPGAARLDASVHFVGAPLSADDIGRRDEGPPNRLIAELDARGSAELIYVALGTLYNDRPDFLRACIAALAGPGRTLLLATGRSVHADALGTLPAGVLTRPFVPQLEVLSRASLFVSHGGMNSVSESLWNGVPLLLFPQAADQPVVADRIQRLGAGQLLRGREPGVDQIRRRAADVLAGPAAARAAELGDTLRAGGGAGRAATLILELAATQR